MTEHRTEPAQETVLYRSRSESRRTKNRAKNSKARTVLEKRRVLKTKTYSRKLFFRDVIVYLHTTEIRIANLNRRYKMNLQDFA